jgi:hypothetical protein
MLVYHQIYFLEVLYCLEKRRTRTANIYVCMETMHVEIKGWIIGRELYFWQIIINKMISKVAAILYCFHAYGHVVP